MRAGRFNDGSLEFRRTTAACSKPDAACITRWRVTPDGAVAISEGNAPEIGMRMIDVVPLRRLVDGPELRAAMRDGITCDSPPTDVRIVMRLELSVQALDREATGCVLGGPMDNVFQQAFGWVKNL